MLSETVRQLGELNFEGNITPHNWFKHPALRLPNGKVNLNAVTILAEIVYWHRPRPVHDERTKELVGWVNRFMGEAFQCNYEALGKKFGLTKLQAQRACYFLRDKGIIRIDRKAVEVEGTMVGNITFLTPIVGKIRDLNGFDPLVTSKSQGSNLKVRRVATSKSQASNLKVASSIENKREIKKEIVPPSPEDLELFREAGGKFQGEA